MAGHNFSRYMSNLWSALFAPFNLLLTRIWRFFARAIQNEKHVASLPSLTHSPSQPSPSSSPSTSSTAANTIPDLPSTPSLFPPNLHHQNSSHPTTSESQPDLSITHGPSTSTSSSTSSSNSSSSEDNSTDLDDAVYSSSQNHQQQQSAKDMSRKRSGRGRGRAKSSSIHQPTVVAPVTPVNPVIPVSADAAQGWPALANQSDNHASSDTNFAPNHTNGSKVTSFERGNGWTCDRNSAIPQQQQPPPNNRKENAVPPKANNTHSQVPLSRSPALAPLAMVDNTDEPQKAGTCGHPAADSSINAMCGRSSVSCSEADQLHIIADRLNLADTPSSEERTQQTLNKATAAAEASALPVPLTVAFPVSSQLQAPESESQTSAAQNLPGLIEPTTDEERAEREYHLKFMREALDMGDLALKTNETPVGCVLVYRGRVIARGMNATNITRNGTRHAEFMALSALLSRRAPGDFAMTDANPDLDDASWGDVDPRDGHIYPYGQKLHPAPVVNRSIISECVLYVTVEPCVMCASLLRQLGIKKVYFGAVNDKFGGTGGVFRVHMNSKPVPIPEGRPYQLGYGPQDVSLISKGRAVAIPRGEDEGDGGNVEPGYPVEGGYLRDDAVSLLRRFYVQENGRAPQPRKKDGRAARLYATLEGQNKNANTSDLSDNAPETPADAEDAEAPMILGSKPELSISIVCA
ncbi:hypothetical protein F5Y10DRAFT_234533 [Nemania abortiva]|nr:hypothetical protein F5Y10DRAFT_234533 [Nemania abortiva]